VKLLLDTHALLWFIKADKHFSAATRAAVESGTDEILVSIATIWEIAIKQSIGKLRICLDIENGLRDFLEENGFDLLNIDYSHVAKVTTLPWKHKDPFDRLLAAQALLTGSRLVSADAVFDTYGIERIW
jgi:PIN domain nuclease of toxin-antitoxin system